MTDYKTIQLKIDDEGIALVTFDRPAVRNALNHEMVRELEDVLSTLSTREDLAALMFTGSEGAEVLYSRVITWPGTGPAAAEAVIPAANPTAVKRCRFNVFIVFIFLRTEFRRKPV